MKKISIILVIILVLLLTGCAAKAPDAALSKILDEIIADIGVVDEIPLSVGDLYQLYGIDAGDVEDQASCITMNGIFPDEIILIKAAGSAAAKNIQKRLEARLAEVKNQSASYDPESYAIAQRCRVNVKGEYICFFISYNHERMTEIYEGFFK